MIFWKWFLKDLPFHLCFSPTPLSQLASLTNSKHLAPGICCVWSPRGGKGVGRELLRQKDYCQHLHCEGVCVWGGGYILAFFLLVCFCWICQILQEKNCKKCETRLNVDISRHCNPCLMRRGSPLITWFCQKKQCQVEENHASDAETQSPNS